MDTGIIDRSVIGLLEWQIEMGATDAIAELPVNRYDLASKPVKKKTAISSQVASEISGYNPVLVSEMLAEKAQNLDSLRQAILGYECCELKRGAKSTVFADGNTQAKIMLIGEAPGGEEDAAGKPFVGRAGQLLDRMFAAIGLSRGAEEPSESIYITNILPWRPPQNRDPGPDEIAMMMPFIKRHVELIGPEMLVLMGNVSCQAILGKKGITKLRGNWETALGLPVLPMFHPAYLLRNPSVKSDAWRDLLAIKTWQKGK